MRFKQLLYQPKLVISYPEGARLMLMNDSSNYYAFKPDTIAKKFVMVDYKDSTIKSTFNYSFPQKDVLLLTGIFKKMQ